MLCPETGLRASNNKCRKSSKAGGLAPGLAALSAASRSCRMVRDARTIFGPSRREQATSVDGCISSKGARVMATMSIGFQSRRERNARNAAALVMGDEPGCPCAGGNKTNS
eukprot:CAMPEP_0169194158 /NCGR_PEP_ID=MMETSP1016-20121227/6551_1 /TAXON_ID=342587 /ORGANISM="Karlodinium micrum, Strain CCMP2283" /LENGTH=110 /DNA_ID=CAMNT_0009270651 /DNA_START=45 /DNA_END=377 /DNA_ORIENTATION=+